MPDRASLRISHPEEMQRAGCFAAGQHSVEGVGAVELQNVWLPRRATINLCGLPPGQPHDVLINLHSGPEKLYRYFPFNAWVRPSGALGEIIEVPGPEHRVQVRLDGAVAGSNGLNIDIDTDLGDIPARIGLSADERELALLLAAIETRPSNAEPPGMRASPHPDPGGPRPVFVIGAYRSGTSITTWAIGQHPNIFALDETGWVHSGLLSLKACFSLANNRTGSAAQIYDIEERRFLGTYARFLDEFHHEISRERAAAIAFARLSGRAESFCSEIQLRRSPKAPKTRWVDGTPENATAGRLLADVYPNSQFIVLVRHPLEVVRSLLHFERAGGRSMAPEDALAVWTRLTALAIDTARYAGPDRALVVTYDEIAEPESVMRRCLAFLGEPYFAPAAAAFGVKLNSSNVESDPLAEQRTARERLAIDLYEQIRSGSLPRLAAFKAPGLDSHDDYMHEASRKVQLSLSSESETK